MRTPSWSLVLSVLVVVAGSPALLSLDVTPAMVCVADVTAIGLIAVVAHLVDSWRAGHAI